MRLTFAVETEQAPLPRRPRTVLPLGGALLLALLVLPGCRGQSSRNPPIRVNPNMVQQERFDPQEPNPWFKDQRAMRPEVPGTVAVGELFADDHLQLGLQSGEPARTLPPGLRLDRAFLERGQERFNVFCSPCHDRAGTGDGMVVRRGMVAPPAFTDPRVRAMPLGQLFQVISRGVRTMPAYAPQVGTPDRWSMVAYVRALQVGRSATLGDVPPDVRGQKGWGK